MAMSGDESLPGMPWDISVDQLVREQNASQQVARDYVILDWLHQGDTRPFTAFVRVGHVPCRDVMLYLAQMMNPADDTENEIPFSLAVKSRGQKGRRSNPENRVRDKLMAQNVERFMETMSYHEALYAAAELMDVDGDGTNRFDTVEKAYKKFKARS
jgi:hypothetical protein